MSRPVGRVRLRPSWLLRVTENSASTRRLNSSKPSLSMMNFIRALWRLFLFTRVFDNFLKNTLEGLGASNIQRADVNVLNYPVWSSTPPLPVTAATPTSCALHLHE